MPVSWTAAWWDDAKRLSSGEGRITGVRASSQGKGLPRTV